ncbi:Myotubularin-related protein [Trichinella pseudospiralis]|uniref:Uncharacterized protein n=1 Tax=Trichinella pseudospiralis TaxID=6337 RepID=A0A0V1G3R3_TRIPS|nr:hypothetical protein T4E_2263 [Trichinella pseudospiralis]KRY92916.1 hypothetical protein T4D_16104 [Trichinella pseudospiralis]
MHTASNSILLDVLVLENFEILLKQKVHNMLIDDLNAHLNKSAWNAIIFKTALVNDVEWIPACRNGTRKKRIDVVTNKFKLNTSLVGYFATTCKCGAVQ